LKGAAWSTDDQSGFITNQKKLNWQFQWAGTQLINLRLLVHQDFLDTPQEQLRTILIPPDPPPLFNARPEPYTIDETDWRVVSDGSIRETQDDKLRVTQPSQTEAEEENSG
jgi:hypothetical protein